MKKIKSILTYTAAVLLFFLSFAPCLFSQTEPMPKHIAEVSFTKSEKQVFKPARTNDIALTDLDKDGGPDAIFSNMGHFDSEVWFNNGDGIFKNSGQKLTQQGHGLGLGDLDGDGDLDVFMTCAGWTQNKVEHRKPSKIYFNTGNGVFKDSGQDLGDTVPSGNAVTLADIDSDGDLDAVVQYYKKDDVAYLNNGKGIFTKSKIKILKGSTFADLDNDGDPDIFLALKGKGYRTLLNDGKGTFKNHGFLEDVSIGRALPFFGDFDNDGDLDVMVTNANRTKQNPTRVLLNDGSGRFKDSGQQLIPALFGRIGIGDLNNDGALDAVITCYKQPASIWLNGGKGIFYKSAAVLRGNGAMNSPQLKDIDNDGDVDIMIGHFLGGQNEIWLNDKKK